RSQLAPTPEVVVPSDVAVPTAGTSAEEKPLLGRKSVLLGMLTSGLVLAEASQASAATTKPASVVAQAASYATRWTPSTAYTLGQQIVSPYNDVVSANAAHTSSAAYSTDVAKWTMSVTHVQQGQTMVDLAKQVGVDSTGVKECAAAIQLVFSSAAAAGVRVFARGTYRIASTVTLTSNADLSDATFKFTGTTGVALRVGGASGVMIDWLQVNLPKMICTAKTQVGWAQVAGATGIELVNLNSCLIYVPRVRGFGTGLRVTARAGGMCYNQLNIAHLDNNKVNLLIDSDTTGWSNQNQFNASRYSHDSIEGKNVPGCRHIAILVTSNAANNNIFVNPSLEGDTPEFHAAIAGTANILLSARWEATQPRIRWESDAVCNQILYGYHAQDIDETFTPGSRSNVILTGIGSRFVGGNGTQGVVQMENSGSNTYPADVVMYAGATADKVDPATAYSVARGASATRMKRTADVADRLVLDHVNGRSYYGLGATAPTQYIGPCGTAIGVGGADLAFVTDNTHDLGQPVNRPRYVRAGTAIVTGAAATGGRPSASVAKAGAMFYDTTLGKPIWSNGSVWKDSAGTTV
ncbi:MAG: hypothetical protein QOE58_1265, partial [Actinomycetota bacterium]|nr:hypothetical protein [Actinomycetota bacterium]